VNTSHAVIAMLRDWFETMPPADETPSAAAYRLTHDVLKEGRAQRHAELEQRLAFAERTVEHLRKSHAERSAASADRYRPDLSQLRRAQIQAAANLDRALRAEQEGRRWLRRAFEHEKLLAQMERRAYTTARADLLNLMAGWGLTTGKGSRQIADRIMNRHARELAGLIRANAQERWSDGAERNVPGCADAYEGQMRGANLIDPEDRQIAGFNPLDYVVLIGDDVVGLKCLRGQSAECDYFGQTENGATFRALPEAARIHHDLHHQEQQ
jgi:hypothetical protein